jgi:FkbM family methyltransferase
MLFVRHLLKSMFLIKQGYSLSSLGDQDTGCWWTLHPDPLGPTSVVYSGGVGKDISFEHELVRQFGCKVVLFDPSPIGLATMALPKNNIPEFAFFKVGLAGKCGTLHLAPPFTPEGDSWFSNTGGSLEVPCLDLTTLMRQNQHSFIDLLKIDIEGAEYGVLDHIIEQRIPVRQILVEFHDGILPGVRLSSSLRSLFKLLGHGYKLLSEDGNNHTFFWTGNWDKVKAEGKAKTGGQNEKSGERVATC